MRNATTTKNVARAKIYRDAALSISKKDFGSFSCSSISYVGGTADDAEAYAVLFRPRGDCGPLWGLGWSDKPSNWQQRNNCRILALCFMAAMVEAGDA